MQRSTNQYIALIDDKPLSDIMRYAAAHGVVHVQHDTVPDMPAVEGRPTVPATPQGKRAGVYSVVERRTEKDGAK